MNKPKILFAYDHKYPALWRDGLWAALKLLEKDFEIDWWNFQEYPPMAGPNIPYNRENIPYRGRPFKGHYDYDFILVWGGFRSPVDYWFDGPANWKLIIRGVKMGICLGGYGSPPISSWKARNVYDVLFYETEWGKKWVDNIDPIIAKGNHVHAFGVNTDIYKPQELPKIYDYLTVGAFARWKRQEKLLGKPGYKMAIGEYQKGNMEETVDILGPLVVNKVVVSDMVEPEKLAMFYNMSKNVYIPADVVGGGERAVLEARACGIPVEVESDNPKLQELLTSPVWDHHYYAEQLKKGILSCLK